VSETIEVTVNGESHQVPAGSNLTDLVRSLDLAPERVAIERNRRIVPRSKWAETDLESGDALEIVHFVGGGMECGARGRRFPVCD